MSQTTNRQHLHGVFDQVKAVEPQEAAAVAFEQLVPLHMRFRVADIIVQDDYLFGDAVNAAARLESSCAAVRHLRLRCVRDYIGTKPPVTRPGQPGASKGATTSFTALAY